MCHLNTNQAPGAYGRAQLPRLPPCMLLIQSCVFPDSGVCKIKTTWSNSSNSHQNISPAPPTSMLRMDRPGKYEKRLLFRTPRTTLKNYPPTLKFGGGGASGEMLESVKRLLFRKHRYPLPPRFVNVAASGNHVKTNFDDCLIA